MMQVTFIVSMIFAVVIALFAVANSEPVTINLIFRSFEMSQAVVILISAVIGAVAVFLMSLVSRAKSAVKVKALNKELSNAKAELERCQSELAQAQEKDENINTDEAPPIQSDQEPETL